MFYNRLCVTAAVLSAALAFTGGSTLRAQAQAHIDELGAAAPEDSAAPQPQQIDKRIAGVLPNYRTADGSQPFKPISAKYKLTIAAKDSFDTPNYVIGGIFAGIAQLNNSHPDFGQGMAGYGRRYGTAYADQVIGNMLTEGFMPVLLKEDPRYFRKGTGTFWRRLGYSLTRTLITKNDSGRTMFNFAEVLGNGIGASIANAYYPDERGAVDTLSRMSTQIATDSLSNVLKEFWPDVKRSMQKKKGQSQ